MAQKQNFADKFWHDKHGHTVVWQRPNPLLITWFVAIVLSIMLPDGSLERYVSFVGTVAIFIWAVLELTRGVNNFRRLLGLGVLMLMLVAHFL